MDPRADGEHCNPVMANIHIVFAVLASVALARPMSAATVDARIAGVREALARHRIEPDPGWIRHGDPAAIGREKS